MAVSTIAGNWSTNHSNFKIGRFEQTVNAYTTHGATDDGEWFDAKGAKGLSVSVGGASPSGTVTVSGSNAATIPADSSDESTVASATDGTSISIDEHQMCRWMKVHLSAFTGGTFTVDLNLKRYSQ